MAPTRQKFDVNFKGKVLVYVVENSGEQALWHRPEEDLILEKAEG